jgi:glycosyltransferase involved in cell wall biosynthesis
MNTGNPKISIITPCLNRVNFIQEAIESVLEQDYQNFEHIVIDGGSTDGTVELVRSYPHIKFISEPDVNLYDAINKGIKLSKGKIIGHLNSDDFYSENIFGDVVQLFEKFPHADIVCGKACILEEQPGTNTRTIIAKLEKHEFLNISVKNVTINPPIINAKFFRKSIYERFGNYNINYPIASDRDFLLRIAINGVNSIACEKTIYNYREHPGSLTIGTPSKELKLKTLKEYLILSESYLKKYGHIKKVQRELTRWHTKITIHFLTIYLRQRKVKNAVDIINRGLIHNLYFPIFVGISLAKSLFRKKG